MRGRFVNVWRCCVCGRILLDIIHEGGVGSFFEDCSCQGSYSFIMRFNGGTGYLVVINEKVL